MSDPLNDLDGEFRHHIDAETQDNIDRGMSPDAARTAALRKFGNVSQIKEDTRAVWTWTWFESLIQDVRYTLRGFRRAPGFALTVVGTIGLALGLNTTLFTVFNAYVLRPFAVRDPYSLYRFNWTTKNDSVHPFTPKEFDDFTRANTTFSEVTGTCFLLTRAEGHQFVGEQVSDNYFEMLVPGMQLGRPLMHGDTGAMVISDSAWRNKFGSDPGILGRRLLVLGGSYEIVGVVRPGFTGMSQVMGDIWVPILRSGANTASRVMVIGRVRDGVSLKQTKAALAVWARQETADRPASQRATGVALESAATAIHITTEMLAVFSPLLVAFALVLVIACANVANMMLARAMARQREIGVRLSLGAGRTRLIRQLLTESLLLALPAALAGLVVSQIAIRWTEDLMFATAPPVFLQAIHFFSLETDFRVFLFILMASVVSTLLFSLAPAIQATRPGIAYAAHGDFSADVRPARLRNTLVAGQVTVCVLLLICSGVLLQAGRKFRASDTRMTATGVIEVRFRQGSVDPKVAERLKQEPGVDLVAAVWRAPLMGPPFWLPFAAGHTPNFVRAGFEFVSPEYFDELRIPLVRGRNFSTEESRSEAAVTIISEATAARF
jgi:predicted permease